MSDIVSSYSPQDKLCCSVCEQEKPRSLFHMINNPNHKWVICKECASIGKHCSGCGKYALFETFPKASNSGNRGGATAYCYDCQRRVKRAEHQRNGTSQRRKQGVRGSQLKSKFGISHEHYIAMYNAQEGRCAACNQHETRLDKNGKIYNLAVDHDHETGEIRSLLCSGCNTAFGLLKEDTVRIRNLLAYAEKYKT